MERKTSLIGDLFSKTPEMVTGPDSGPILLSTRIRFARNLNMSFPNKANDKMRKEIYRKCSEACKGIAAFKGGYQFEIAQLSELEREVLVERHLISPEFVKAKSGSGVMVSKDQGCAIMINEEDHLRIQVIKGGFNFKKAFKLADAIDSLLEEVLDYAFSAEWGYLTACPTNIGTGMRASVMMHLPGLVMADHMEKVIRAVSHLGIAVRGLFGEGSDANGSIFQISNQQTLGENEQQIMKRLGGVLETIIEQENNARVKLAEENRSRFYDKIGRAYGILRYGCCVSSAEAMNLLSLVRLGIDFGFYPEEQRSLIDALFIKIQPGHMEFPLGGSIDETDPRDTRRARELREIFKKFPQPKL